MPAMTSRRPTPRDVELLLSFLVDDNAETARLARRQVTELARKTELRALIEGISDPKIRVEGRRVLEDVRLSDLEKELRQIASAGDGLDLERGVFLLARFGHADADTEGMTRQLDAMAAGLEEAVDSTEPDSLEAADLLRHYLFQELGFRGNADHYQDPDNSYFNRVLERRLGIPISLSCVALFVGWRLDVPVFGVGLPGHFVIGHETPRGPRYLDPFNGGRVLSKADCASIALRAGAEFDDRMLEPAGRAQILSRMMVNLLNIYADRGDDLRVRWLTRWLDFFTH